MDELKLINGYTFSIEDGASLDTIRHIAETDAANGRTTSVSCHFTNTGIVIVGDTLYNVLVQGTTGSHVLTVVQHLAGANHTKKQSSTTSSPSVSFTQVAQTVTFKWAETNTLTVTNSTNNSIAIIATA